VVEAMQECGREILRGMETANVHLDYFFVALGNGSTALGLSEALAPKGIPLVGVEPAESPNVAETLAESDQDTPLAKRMREDFGNRRPVDQLSEHAHSHRVRTTA
jgi:threonine dehydratase